MNRLRFPALVPVLAFAAFGCSNPTHPAPEKTGKTDRTSILLVTLDTTRADAMGYENNDSQTPSIDALAARGMRFDQAWTTAPMTLPSHTSILTGLYPADHGIHENSRFLSEDQVVLTQQLNEAGYRTAAFISGYPLKRRFGLARGFDHFDDDLGDGNGERPAAATTERVLTYLETTAHDPLFLWVHYFDPHEPYAPPEPYRSRISDSPYLAEVASMDHELGRLIDAFDALRGSNGARIIVVGDHGEGLGDHGETLHGNLLYRGVMRVPLILAGHDIPASVIDTPVSTRRIFHTIRAWAGLESDFDLTRPTSEVVLAEALKPYLQYGWAPQVMAVAENLKVIQSGTTEVYDLSTDPEELDDLSDRVDIDPAVTRAIAGYRIPKPGDRPSANEIDQEDLEQLASLGYADWQGSAPIREHAPNPRSMTHLFDDLDRGSALFVKHEYERSIEVFDRVLAEDPENLMVTVRLAVAHSILGHERRAEALFERARAIGPESIDGLHYLAMHHVRYQRWERAAPLFEQVLQTRPKRLPALEALARIRERQDRLDEAAHLIRRTIVLKERPEAEWVRLGELEMAMGRTPAAIDAFEQAESLQGNGFQHHLELGVLYLADGDPARAAAALDRVGPDHPGYPMALFKRAQVAVILGEPDWANRVRTARELGDPMIRDLIDREPLFQRPATGLR